ncbi:MAG: hypothetical protein COB20_10790 [SAR86 cluster bacterium]|uniref:Uncharacterized protein n=1 Tax=SAR86 cluster bacterium TaxID=2030880 RepID=A0A2A4X2R9_9GAMM|nr:MAG: hypothetical protein COB20_10790 [SAR86 cluster bacterium]
MNIENSPYIFYQVLAIVAFLVVDSSSGIIASISIGGDTLSSAAKDQIYYTATQPAGSAFLLLPYLTLSWISASLARKKLFESSKFIFFLGVMIIWTMTALGYRSAELLMQDGYYTAAIFEVAFLPLEFIPWLLVLLFIRYMLVRKSKET